MEFRIADTFTDSLARLTGDEQKAVKMTAFDLQINPAHPSLQFHKLDKPKDPNFSSVRVNNDIRLIVHKTPDSLLLCYVDHHDKAYQWAERRKLEVHPKTGAAQIVEIRETVREIIIPRYVEAAAAAAPAKQQLFAGSTDDELLSYGVPAEWLDDVRRADEDSLLGLADHLPAEAAEALLELATGGKPVKLGFALATREAAGEVRFSVNSLKRDPFAHPDAQRRFRTVKDIEELERALEYPWERWTVFLHPAQREIVERDYNGPARVAGSAGTGKTVVALHRAAFLARKYPDSRVLLTTFSDTLANALQTKLRRLIHNEPRLGERIDVWSFDAIARRMFKRHPSHPRIATPEKIREIVKEASDKVGGHNFSLRFILSEWNDVVDAWQLDSWEAYRDVRRLGRNTRLPEPQRARLWAIFEHVREMLANANVVTYAGFFAMLTTMVKESTTSPFDFVVVDEAQDIGIPHLRFLAALGRNRPNALFFAGDLGQRIFQQPFSWRALGVDVRGRSRTLRVNYRTSHQIRTYADRLLGPEVADVDGNVENRRGTVSVFNGPAPQVIVCNTREEETKTVARWISKVIADGILPHELGIFVRSDAEIDRACAAVAESGFPSTVLDRNVETIGGSISIGTMNLAKGLEFRAVVVMACDDEIIPSQDRIGTVGDDAELEDVYNTERYLLYVACTRARDHLLATGVDPASEFLEDLTSP